jgi:putative oxidoreductase
MANGNYGFEIPLLYLIMLLPLFFTGAGKLSLDHLISGYMKKR